MFDLDFTKPRIATLSSETLSRVKALEQELGGAWGELGLCMVAYEKPASRS
ncbi:MAG: hypothetical protein HYU36_09695 [Planctomycetes bacterium]|nr:hypothetical protein [Planctomycetota bacterium]